MIGRGKQMLEARMEQDRDPIVRKALRSLLIFQGLALVSMGSFAVGGNTAAIILLLVLGILAALSVLGISYLRYRNNPQSVEKRALLKRKALIEKGIAAEQGKIEAAQKRRATLSRAEQAEVAAANKAVQQAHIERGLRRTPVLQADILGVGPKLKERLTLAGITTAADVSQTSLSTVQGFGEAKTAAVLAWRSSVVDVYDLSKPMTLPSDQAGEIAQKYQSQNGANDEKETAARGTKQALENDLTNHLPKLEPFAAHSFSNYLLAAMSANRANSLMLLRALLGSFGLAFGIVGIALASAAGRAGTTAPAVDYSAISTSAFQTALASQLGTVQASAPTRLATLTAAPRPTETETAVPTLAAFVGIEGAECIPANPAQTGKVVSITDGDTIRVLLDDDGQTYSVRYIGIDTAEMSPPGQTFAAEANARNTELAYGKAAVLVKDVSETDQYGRLLRYVIVDDVFVNYELVASGFAQTVSYPPDTACNPTFGAMQQQAVTQQMGVWAPVPTMALLPTLGAQATAAQAAGGGPCDCRGFDLDCENFSSHASAQACYEYCAGLGLGDIFRLDRDSDGSACETLP
jgi:endonuclease YncB( thermonuclease family)/predicted flap endonuclease-1-like 5' DNA nuclease